MQAVNLCIFVTSQSKFCAHFVGDMQSALSYKQKVADGIFQHTAWCQVALLEYNFDTKQFSKPLRKTGVDLFENLTSVGLDVLREAGQLAVCA